MRDGHAASLGWVLELNMAALLGDLYPTVRFQGFDDVLRLHVCTNTHKIGIFVKCIDTHASIVSRDVGEGLFPLGGDIEAIGEFGERCDR